MERRSFLKTLMLTALVGSNARAASEVCLSESNGLGVIGQSQGFFEVRHRHQFFIPLAILLEAPEQGFTARCSTPLKGQTDFEGLKNRKNNDGSPLDLREHAHTVALTQAQLVSLSLGRHVTVDLAKFGHSFYFVADDNTLQGLKRLRDEK